MSVNPKRIASGAAAIAVAAAAFSVLHASPAPAVGVNAGPAQVVVPFSSTPLPAGGSDTDFSLNLPDLASCTGDSANQGYLIQSYRVPADVDPATLQFNSAGPVGPGFFPLFDTFGSPYVNKLTAPATPSPGPGQIVNIPAFDYAIFVPPDDLIPPGTYNIGIACTFGPQGPNQIEKFWNVQKTFTSNPADSPGQRTFVVNAEPTPVVPEVPLAVLLPLTTLALLGGGTMVLRRRRSAVLA